MTIPAQQEAEIIRRYREGESPLDMAADFGLTRGAIKQLLHRRGELRSQSEAGSLAAAQGKKNKFIEAGVRACKRPENLYHPGKRYHGEKNCQKCGHRFTAIAARQKWCATCCPNKSARARLQRYNLSQPEFDNLLAAQGNACAVCQKPDAYVVDHDHRCCKGTRTCGRCLRGILCYKCNAALAALERDAAWLERAAKYLQKKE